MRKYFLLSAVVLLSATNVMAENSMAGGNFTATVSVIMVDEISCNQGLILSVALKDNTSPTSITLDPSGVVTSITDSSVAFIEGVPAICSLTNNTFDNTENIFLGSDSPITLLDSAGDNLVISNSTISDFTFKVSDDRKSISIGATLNLESNINPSQYWASIPVMYYYE
ncbi:MAG: DUF4402 domain-containing protein [Alphaproteobacteria bacterium]|nr:DUF4402 domain-containing protein [Alphaproteobacteria bacterium]